MSEGYIVLGDCLDKMKRMPENCVDSVVTDPPYGLSFMGKAWDHGVPSAAIWREVLRVLKPGGHLLSFSGSRTYHRMACNIEDAGFQIRDQIMWIYGSGFPKNMNVQSAMDKQVGRGDEAGTWQGWGTALKPAHEPIVLARKPLSGTVVDNILKHGTGALNIDGCRVPTTDALGGGAAKAVQSDKPHGWDRPWRHDPAAQAAHAARIRANIEKSETLGRFPANIILDAEAGKILDASTGISGVDRRGKCEGTRASGFMGVGSTGGDGKPCGQTYADVGGASRFFYCPKASKKDRGPGNEHPTVKPTDLMRYLVRLITPPAGVCLDPFMGSGSTGKACDLEGCAFVGIEQSVEYVEIAKKRLHIEDSVSIKRLKIDGILKGVQT